MLRATVIDLDNDRELIIGMPTVTRARLLLKLEQQLYGRTIVDSSQHDSLCQSAEGGVSSPDQATHIQTLNSTTSSTADNQGAVGEVVRESAKKFLDPVDNAIGIELKVVDTPWQRVIDGESVESTMPAKILGLAEEQAILREFLQ